MRCNLSRVCLFCLLTIIFVLSSQKAEVSITFSDSVATHIVPPDHPENILPSEVPLFCGLNLRKYAHIILFCLLGVFSVLSMPIKYNLWEKTRASSALCIIVSVLDEIHQMFVPGRTALIKDVIIDCFGSSIGIILIIVLGRVIIKFRTTNNNRE